MKAKLTKCPDIGSFHDPVSFLDKYFDFKRQTEKDFSLRSFSEKCGLAVGLLPMILKRKRPLTEKTYRKVKASLDLSESEKKYLDLLIVISLSEVPKERMKALSQLQNSQYYSEKNQNEIDTFKYLSNWENVVIREMVRLKDFEYSPEKIKKRLRTSMSLNEIKQCIDFLIEHKFIYVNKTNTLVAEKNLNCEEGVFKISLGQFHRQILSKVAEAIDDVPRNDRMILGHTVALTNEQFNELNGRMKEWLREVEQVGLKEKKVSGEVYHLEMALVPLTSRSEK